MVNSLYHVSNRLYLPSRKDLPDYKVVKIILLITVVSAIIKVAYTAIQSYLYPADKASKFQPRARPARLKSVVFNNVEIEPIQENIHLIQETLEKRAPWALGKRVEAEGRIQHGDKTGIFSLKSVPNLIFKKETRRKIRGVLKKPSKAEEMFIEKRCENIEAAQQLIEKEKFQHLRVAKTVQFTITKDRAQYRFLAQEKFAPLLGEKGRNGKQRPLKIKDANLSDEALAELIKFILKTGFFDVADRNFLVIKEDGEIKIAVIDFEYVDLNRLETAFKGGFINETTQRRSSDQETILGIFNMLPEKRELIEKVLKENKRSDLIPLEQDPEAV